MKHCLLVVLQLADFSTYNFIHILNLVNMKGESKGECEIILSLSLRHKLKLTVHFHFLVCFADFLFKLMF